MEDHFTTQILNFLKVAQLTLDLSDDKMGTLFGVSAQNFVNIKKGISPLRAKNLLEGVENLNVTIEKILKNEIDYLALEKQFKGVVSCIPEKYAIAAYSKKRTVINILDYVEKKFGILEKNLLLRKFQVGPNAISQPDENINMLFGVELLEELRARGCTEEQIVEMGVNSYYTNKDKFLGNQFKELDSNKELLQFFFESAITNFDTNTHYNIHKLTDNFCEIRMYQNHDVLDAFRVDKIGSFTSVLMKSGVIKSLPRYIGNEDFKIHIGKTIHRDDDYCSFEIDFANLKNGLKDKVRPSF